MDVIAALRRRRTTRAFEPDGIRLQRETIEDLIAAACLSPSEYNLQPWRFVVVRDQERKEVLYNCVFRREMVRDAAAVVIVCGDTRGHEGAGRVAAEWVEMGLVPEGDASRVEASIKATYDAGDRQRLTMAVRGPAMVAMSLMLLATESGIATAPIVAFSDDALRRAFHIPDRFVPVILVALGMPSTAHVQPPRCPRVPVAAVVFHEDMGGEP